MEKNTEKIDLKKGLNCQLGKTLLVLVFWSQLCHMGH